MLLKKLGAALNNKLAEFEKKAKELEQEPQKFELKKQNMLSSLMGGAAMKKQIAQKLDDARARLEEAQMEQRTLERVVDDTDSTLKRLNKEVKSLEKEKAYVDQ